MHKEFYWDYLKACDNLVKRFIKESKTISKNAFAIESTSIEKAVANFIWEKIFFSPLKETYSFQKLQNESGEEIIRSIWKDILKPLLPLRGNCMESLLKYNNDNQYKEILQSYQCTLFFYCKNNRQLTYLLPLINGIAENIVILSFEELDEDLIQRNNIQIIEVDLIINEVIICQKYIEEKFPRLFFLFNTFSVILDILRPQKIILLEGCHFDQEILSSVGKAFAIKTICIQQGWPSLTHTRFINMSYDYFFTWGKILTNLWKQHNLYPKYIETGYIYEVIQKTPIEKTSIAFFFQAPLFIISQDTFNKMIDFAFFCAIQFPERKILIREHPEYCFSKNVKEKIKSFSNVEIATHIPLAEFFSRAIVGVSVFSSTLIEGMAHYTIPFVFNLTSLPRYYPDIEKKGLGIEVKSCEEAQRRIVLLLNDNYTIQNILENIYERQKEYFDCCGKDAVNKTLKIVEEIN